MPAPMNAALADDAEEFSLPVPAGEYVTRTEFELAVKQIMARIIKIQINSRKTEIGILQSLLNSILKH